MIDPPKVAAARIEAARRRGEMLGTVHELQSRLAPRTLASDAWAKARNKGADMAEDAVDAVKARPVAVGGAAAALGLFLARRPIADAAVKLYDALTSRDETKVEPPALKTKQKPRSTPRPDGDVR
jgi:hypothetical protein